jgi:hypothetical protein
LPLETGFGRTRPRVDVIHRALDEFTPAPTAPKDRDPRARIGHGG